MRLKRYARWQSYDRSPSSFIAFTQRCNHLFWVKSGWPNLTHTIILHFSLRILVTGAAANFTSVSNLVGNVFNAHVFVLLSQVDSAQISPHRNAPAQEYRSWASLGGGYVTQWVWGCEWGSGCSSGKSVSAVSTRCLWGEAIVRQALLKMLQW